MNNGLRRQIAGWLDDPGPNHIGDRINAATVLLTRALGALGGRVADSREVEAHRKLMELDVAPDLNSLTDVRVDTSNIQNTPSPTVNEIGENHLD